MLGEWRIAGAGITGGKSRLVRSVGACWEAGNGRSCAHAEYLVVRDRKCEGVIHLIS
jgi:hypothetical protein